MADLFNPAGRDLVGSYYRGKQLREESDLRKQQQGILRQKAQQLGAQGQRQSEARGVLGQAMQAQGEERQGLLKQAFMLDPEQTKSATAYLSGLDEAQRAEALRENESLTRTALDALTIQDPIQRRQYLNQKRQQFIDEGRTTENIDDALSGDDSRLNQLLTMQARSGIGIQQLAKQQILAPQEQAQEIAKEERDFGRKLQLEEFKQMAPTALVKNLYAAGVKEGSPEFNQAILSSIQKPGEVIESTPDGGFRITRGNTKPSESLNKTTIKDLESKIASNMDNLSRLEVIEQQYVPDFLTYGGKVSATISKLKSKAGFDLSPEDERFLQGRRRFTQGINQMFNAYRKEITGAAAAVQELESLKKAMLSEDLSPTEFKASFDEFKSELLRSNRLSRKILREGVRDGFGKDLDRLFTAGLDDDIEARGQELRAQGFSDQAIVDALIKEGYASE